ncbi:MAG: NUDIX hydrolase YfcD [Desulfobulbaceae bacterium]
MDNSPEFVQIVDEHNTKIAEVSRRLMREQNLIHRASYVLVFNSRGELFVQQRTLSKDIYPGCHDIAAGGVVVAGESYEESAERELAEELGIRDVALRPCFDHYFEDERNRVWGRIFRCQHDGPFVLQPEEVAGGRFMPLDQILAVSEQEPFTPDGLQILQRLRDSGD